LAKEFAFKPLWRHGRTVDFDERTPVTPAVFMNASGHKLFADTGFAFDKHRRIRRRDSARLLKHMLE
jgi:hypothetical protein